METKPFEELTNTDQAIVIALMEPRTKRDLVEFLSLSFDYTSQRLPKLKEMGYLEILPPTSKPLYHTVHFYATQHLYEMKADSTGTVNECLISWSGRLMNPLQIIRDLEEWQNSNHILGFFGHCQSTIHRLRVNSELRDSRISNVSPTNKELREHLALRITQEERYILFARKILAADSIWSERKEVWCHIANTPITEAERKTSQKISDKIHPSTPNVKRNTSETKKKVEEIVAKREPTKMEMINRRIMDQAKKGGPMDTSVNYNEDLGEE